MSRAAGTWRLHGAVFLPQFWAGVHLLLDFSLFLHHKFLFYTPSATTEFNQEAFTGFSGLPEGC